MSIILSALDRLLQNSTQATTGRNEKDDVGLTGFEVQGARGAIAKMDEKWAARILRRYVKTQLTADEAAAVLATSQDPDVRISKMCDVTLGSRIGGKLFDSYKEYCKTTLGARFQGAPSYAWRIQQTQVADAVAWFTEHGFIVTEAPVFSEEEVKVAQEQAEIHDKSVFVRFEDQKVHFQSARYSPEFNNLFNNRAGKISGVTEYIEETHERATMSIPLAEEAMARLAELGFILNVKSSYQQAKREYDLKEVAFESQDPEVTAKLNPDLKLFHHQNKAISFIENAGGRCIVGAAMGSGKTAITLAWAAKNNLRVCVVCPKVVRRTWVQEAKKFFPEFFKTAFELDRKFRKPVNPKNFSLVSLNYENVDKWEEFILHGEFDLLIIDESHFVKNFKAKRTQALLKIATSFKHRILLSGTVVKNNRYELHPQLQLVNPELYDDSCTLFRQTTGKFWHDIQDIYLAMPKSEVLAFLPAKTTHRFDQEVEAPIGLPNCLEEVTLFKHQCALSKVDLTIEKIQDILDSSDDSILVFSEFIDVCQAIHEHFKNDSIYHDGQMPHEKREAAKEEFQSETNEKRIFISTRPALAVGATLTRANHVVFNDLPWNAADIQQGEDRTHRIGQHKTVNVHWVVAENSDFDVRLITVIERKYRIQKAVTEGKQITAEEAEFLKQPISFFDFKKQNDAA